MISPKISKKKTHEIEEYLDWGVGEPGVLLLDPPLHDIISKAHAY